MQFRRLAGYLLLAGLTVIVCILAFRITLPEPRPEFRLDRAEVSEDGTHWQAVTLPHQDAARATPYIYRLSFDHAPEDDVLRSVLLPRFTSRVEVAINGATVLDSRGALSTARPDRNIPEIAAIPAALLKAGQNDVIIRLWAGGPLSAFLGKIYVGPDGDLRPAYNLRIFAFVTLPVVFAAWQAIVGIILATIWFSRRKEPAYGVLAAAMAAGVVQGFIGMAQQRFPQWILGAAPVLESALMLLFMALFLGYRLPRYYGLIFAPVLAIALLGLSGAGDVQRFGYLMLGPPTVGLCLLVTLALLIRAAARGNRASLYLGLPLVAVLTGWAHDILIILNFVPDQRILLGRLFYSAVLIVIGSGLTWRFVQALNELDSFAGRLVERVAEAEEKLRESFAREEIRSRNEALAAERTRLMRDLHDGLGGQLVSIVALSEQTGTDGARIGEAARAALKDLRLVIDAMDDIDGDLMLVLGSWRERTMAQLRAHAMRLDWHVRGEGIPAFADLRPWHVIQILRLLDEAVTNAVKHSGARTVKVSLETVFEEGEAPAGQITIEDDGRGFAAPEGNPEEGREMRRGRGLLNMQRRAELCGAQLSISSGKQGTCICLNLPRRLPATGIAAS